MSHMFDCLSRAIDVKLPAPAVMVDDSRRPVAGVFPVEDQHAASGTIFFDRLVDLDDDELDLYCHRNLDFLSERC